MAIYIVAFDLNTKNGPSYEKAHDILKGLGLSLEGMPNTTAWGRLPPTPVISPPSFDPGGQAILADTIRTRFEKAGLTITHLCVGQLDRDPVVLSPQSHPQRH